MASIQERLQLKREPLDQWSVREKLCLASAVSRSGDQNWMSVSRALKPFGEPNRPLDWFHQKNCAAQYGALLGNFETPKRKKRISSVDSSIETPADCILKKLLVERQAELKKLLTEEKNEYLKIQEDMIVLQSGKVSEDQLDKWCREIDEEEYKKDQENLKHNEWIKDREQRKQEIERAWRPAKSLPAMCQKRKSSDVIESFLEEEVQQQIEVHQPQVQTPEPGKPALSPLLTSLLKSPSQNVTSTPSILHTVMTHRQIIPCTNTNPMIASLLNSTTDVSVSPGLQQLVSTAIGKEIPTPDIVTEELGSNQQQQQQQKQEPICNDILDDASVPNNIKIDDLANSILVRDGPLPEIKKEDVDDIISEMIEGVQDIVADPEQHLQLDNNGDININLELDDFEEITEDPQQPLETPKTEEPIKVEEKVVEKTIVQPEIDPFEFQEDPVVFEPTLKVSSKQDVKQYVPHYQPQVQVSQPVIEEPAVEVVEKEIETQEEQKTSESNNSETKLDECAEVKIEDDHHSEDKVKENTERNEKGEEVAEAKKEVEHKPNVPGSVEIVEVVVLEEEDMDKELNKSQIQDIVHSTKTESIKEEIKLENNDSDERKTKAVSEESGSTSESKEILPLGESSTTTDNILDKKKDNINVKENTESTTITPDFTDELYDDVSLEVKIDRSGKVKRDYSRIKKKEFDMLLAIEKAHLEESELIEEAFSDNSGVETEKKDPKGKIKCENERSNSPWTEEEDNSSRNKRRYSTPHTPLDSVPNSPASSTTAQYEDDREYRNWKKSVILVYNRLTTNKYASLFLKPITDDQAPGYSSIVQRPMDLQTIKRNIDNGTIRSTLEFKRETMLMFTNAFMYNKTYDTVYNMAMEMQQEAKEAIEMLMQAQGQVDTPLRRETRTSESGNKRKRTFTDEPMGKFKKRKED